MESPFAGDSKDSEDLSEIIYLSLKVNVELQVYNSPFINIDHGGSECQIQDLSTGLL